MCVCVCINKCTYECTYVHTYVRTMETRISKILFFSSIKKKLFFSQTTLSRKSKNGLNTFRIWNKAVLTHLSISCEHYFQRTCFVVGKCSLVCLFFFKSLRSNGMKMFWFVSSLADPGAGEGDALSAGVPEVLWANAQCKQGLQRVTWSQTWGLKAQRETPHCRHPGRFLPVKTT